MALKQVFRYMNRTFRYRDKILKLAAQSHCLYCNICNVCIFALEETDTHRKSPDGAAGHALLKKKNRERKVNGIKH